MALLVITYILVAVIGIPIVIIIAIGMITKAIYNRATLKQRDQRKYDEKRALREVKTYVNEYGCTVYVNPDWFVKKYPMFPKEY